MKKTKTTIARYVLTGVFLFITVFNYTYAQTKAEKLDALISTYTKYGKFNGTILVADKGVVIFKKGYGWANAEWEIPNQPDTKFRLASISKQFTAMLIVQLAAENKLKLDAPISTYLPDYPKKTGEIITTHHLLTHTSGIPGYTSFPGYRDMMSDPIRPEAIVKLFADSALEFTPGEKFEYSNSGYALLGYIIEKVTGKSYEQVLQEKIFTPLKMNNSGYDHNDIAIKNRASGYDKRGNTFVNSSYIDMSVPFAAGGIYSTVEDLYLWDQALYSEKLLPQKYRDLLFDKHIVNGRNNYYGYGWSIGETPAGNSDQLLQTISHSGGINGFSTQITRMPSDKSLIVLLSNTSGAPLREMVIAINGILYDKPFNLPKQSIAFTMFDIIEKSNLDKALHFYEEVRDSSSFYLSEGEINDVGYQLLNSNRAKEAAAVFKINVDTYPQSFNVYDSYGEALLAMGNKPLAIENYTKSVQLNPGNENGLKVLKEQGVNTDNLVKKVPVEHLRLLEGEYATEKGDWKIVFDEVEGVLIGNDKGYKYKLVPIDSDKYVNPDDGATLVFNSSDKSAITLALFGRNFKKVK